MNGSMTRTPTHHFKRRTLRRTAPPHLTPVGGRGPGAGGRRAAGGGILVICGMPRTPTHHLQGACTHAATAPSHHRPHPPRRHPAVPDPRSDLGTAQPVHRFRRPARHSQAPAATPVHDAAKLSHPPAQLNPAQRRGGGRSGQTSCGQRRKTVVPGCFNRPHPKEGGGRSGARAHQRNTPSAARAPAADRARPKLSDSRSWGHAAHRRRPRTILKPPPSPRTAILAT